MHWWMAELWEANKVLLVSWVVWVIVSIVLHELAHGWSAIRAGDDTPIVTGHMTWSPLVHLGAASLIMFALFGFCWGAMPVNPSRFRGRHDEAIVAASGPAMNLALALVAALLTALWIRFAGGLSNDTLRHNVLLFLSVGVGVNLFGMLFNLIPIPPLDGSRIVWTYVPAYRRLVTNENAALVLLFVAMLVMTRLSGSVFVTAMELGALLVRGAVSILGGAPASP